MTGLVIGTHVPWNAAWSEEGRYEIRPCRWAGGRMALWSPHKPGEGRPVFAKPHMVRQRQSVARMLCTVCGEPTPPGNRFWFQLGHVREGRFMTTESPVHKRCADHALAVCPHLRGREDRLEPFPANWQIAFSMVGGTVAEDDFGLRFPPQGVVGHMKFTWPASYFEVAGRSIAAIGL